MGIPVADSTLRELIPRSNSGRLDESAPLSAPDVIALLENIRARSEGIKEKVQRTVTSYHEEFLRIITQSNQSVVNVENVADRLKNVIELLGEKDAGVSKDSVSFPLHDKSNSKTVVGDHKLSAEDDSGAGQISRGTPVDVEICNLSAQVQGLRSKVKENEKALGVVETISSLHSLILATEKKFLPGQLVEAANDMVFLQRKLGLKDGQQQDSGNRDHRVKVFKLLQDEWSDRYNKLVVLLDDLVSKAIVLDERKSELTVIQHITSDMVEDGVEAGAVDLSSILTAMDVLGVLDVRLAKFGDAIIKHVLSPLLKNSQGVVSTLLLGSGAGSTPRSVLKWSFGTQSAETVLESLYPKIVQVIKFLNEHILGNHDGRMTRFGRTVWPRLADAIIAGSLSKAVPSETSQLKDFEHIAEVTTSFEKELANEGLIANFDPAKGDRLRIYASDVEVHFAAKKKKQMLAKVRGLLMQSDYCLARSKWMNFGDEDSNTGPDRSIYLFPDPCAISLLARSLLETVHDTLQDVCLSTPRTALELYHACRDAILMYRAIIPLKLGARSDRLRVAALCYNDSLYIAHEVLTFKYQYDEELPPSLKPVFTFVDLVPLFRKMAEEVLDKQIKVVMSVVMKILDRAKGFQYTDEDKNFQLAKQTLNEVFETFANVDKQLRPVLSHNGYLKVAGRLINMAAGRIISEVLVMNDIGVQETLQLQKLLRIVQDRCPVFLSTAVVDVSAKEQIEEEALENLVPVWRKLKILTNLLDMSLVAINQAWESGDLSSAGFLPSEVQSLVRAIFSATPLREECLQRIGSSSR
ncbi:unnamed protein product [Calypogeia fissa]